MHKKLFKVSTLISSKIKVFCLGAEQGNCTYGLGAAISATTLTCGIKGKYAEGAPLNKNWGPQ